MFLTIKFVCIISLIGKSSYQAGGLSSCLMIFFVTVFYYCHYYVDKKSWNNDDNGNYLSRNILT